jgi:hypothetical protein
LRLSIVTEVISPMRAPLTPSRPADDDPAVVGRRQVDPVLPAQQAAAREHDEVAARLERSGRDVLEVLLRRGLDNEARRVDELVEREEGGGGAQLLEEALGLGAVARRRAGQSEARNALVEGAAHLPADRTESDDAHVHRGRMVSCCLKLE